MLLEDSIEAADIALSSTAGDNYVIASALTETTATLTCKTYLNLAVGSYIAVFTTDPAAEAII